jgi:hypothetical protein
MTLAFVALLLIRLVIPVALLITLGEWVHRREANYWLRR